RTRRRGKLAPALLQPHAVLHRVRAPCNYAILLFVFLTPLERPACTSAAPRRGPRPTGGPFGYLRQVLRQDANPFPEAFMKRTAQDILNFVEDNDVKFVK